VKAFQLGCGLLLAIPLLLLAGVFVIALVANGGVWGWVISFVALGIGAMAGLGAMAEK